MNKTNKNAFTLVELLAVIVILAIILVIAVPKVMSVIDDSKRATLESTAKMIASAAEKAKVQNTVLGKDKEINCKDVVKLNDIDYDKCIIEFDNSGNALVTIKGSGKFESLNVCSVDKTNATASNNACNVSYGKASTYIEKLEAFTTTNGLIVDTTPDKNIRYAGSNPNNKVYFSCKDTDNSNNLYGSDNYDYANSCEVWRIIGVFEVDNGEGKLEKRVKLVRDAFTDSNGNQINMSFDSSSNDINSGYGINQWGPSTYEDGTFYEGADLMQLLNGYYIGEGDKCNYCNGMGQETCENVCTSSVIPLSKVSLSMIENVLWKLGSVHYSEKLSVLTMYTEEKGTQTGKMCLQDIYCNDKVKRTIKWIGKIGLIYPSDYGYASTYEDCLNDIYGSDSTCSINNWLHPSSGSYMSMSACKHSTGAVYTWAVDSTGHVYCGRTYSSYNIRPRPSLYLSSNVQIIGGNGDDEPYKLKI